MTMSDLVNEKSRKNLFFMLRSTFAKQAPEHSYLSLSSRFWATAGSAAFVADFHRVDHNNSNTNNSGD